MSETIFSINGETFAYTNEETKAAAAKLYTGGVADRDHKYHSLMLKVSEYVDQNNLGLHFSVLVLDALITLIENGNFVLAENSPLPAIELR